ncbi:hypothetical protein [Aminipila sp.]|uniref:hypothetical protein n=1 Tax=Aminipila sp. TaxID=2060095 RepID=UPI00289D8565|nr:hypothetical protein [Aminipila sp.]
MKFLLYFFGIFLIFSAFSIYQVDNDIYLLQQEQLKHICDDCSAAAMLYYDEDSFAKGDKVFNKTAGNDAIEYLIQNDFKDQPKEYLTYYFEGDGTMTRYNGSQLVGEEKGIEYPYTFEEKLTGYKSLVSEPRVIVTIDMGDYDYRLTFMRDQRLIRTSGYEYVGG